MTRPFHYVYLCSLFLSIAAANDWNKPCFSGVCHYDLPSTNGHSSGTFTIWGPSSSIGDITPAAGWAILDCSPDSIQQTVRLACINEGSPDCAHLFSNTTNLSDAVGKVVRLPEACGRGAFGFVTNATLHEDQSFPPSMISSLTRRDGTLPTVHGLHINTNTADWTSVGQNVHFFIHIPHDDTTLQSRGTRDLIDDIFDDILDKVTPEPEFNESVSLGPVEVVQNFTVIDQTISCGEFDGRVSIHVDTKSYVAMNLGVIINGTIVPPKVDSISLTGNIAVNMASIVDVKSNIKGTLDTGGIRVYEQNFGGLNIPGILSIGPSLIITALATATLDAQVDMKVGSNYNINQPSFTFINQQQPAEAVVQPGDTPLKVDFTSTVNTTGTQTVSVHLSPSINFLFTVFGKGVKAFVNIQSITTTTLTPNEQSQKLPPEDGCLDTDAKLSINAGADADLFGLQAGAQTQLYDQSWQLIKQCFGSSPAKRSLPSHREVDLHQRQSFNFQCLSLPSLSPQSIIDSIIPASSITKI